MKHGDLKDQIIRVFYKVYNTLDYGFFERVYKNAFYFEQGGVGINVEKKKQILVSYCGNNKEEYYADLIIDDVVIVDLKAGECLCEEHAQLLNYLKATDKEVGLS